MEGFRLAARRRGAYADALDAAALALQECTDLATAQPARAVEPLAELVRELLRLQTNLACRASSRSEVLVPLRARCALLRRTASSTLRECRADRPSTSPPPPPPASPPCCELMASGARHLCEACCYFRAYEPARVTWAANLAAGTLPARVRSPYFARTTDKGGTDDNPADEDGTDDNPAADTDAAAAASSSSSSLPWRPPRSPIGLLEELLWDRPWALLLSCILLNQTTRRQVDPVLARLLRAYPDAAAMAAAEPADVEVLLRPLGLHRRRAQTLVAFSRAFLEGTWRSPLELPGIGPYAADAYAIFCTGRWRESECEPRDHALRWYVDYLRSVEGASGGRHEAGQAGGAAASPPLGRRRASTK